MKYIILSCFVIFSIAKSFSQSSLSGRIISQESGQTIVANVYFPQIELGTISGFDGTFLIEEIPDGTYTLIVSAIGFTSISEKVTFRGSQNIEQNFELLESAVEIEEVIISTPFHKLQRDNVMKVERLSSEEMNKKGAVTLADGITQIAGVSTISTGPGIGKPVIRGLSSNRVLTYTQGIRLENQQFGDEHGLGINEAGIESIEVIKGPATLLYGSDALGGVLYLNPEGFAPTSETEADASSAYISNTQGYKLNAGVQHSGKRLKFLGRMAYVTHSDYETGTGILVTNSRFNETDLKTGVRYQNNKLKSTVRYNYNRANIGIAEEIGAQDRGKGLMQPFQTIDNHILSLENTVFFGNSSLDVKLGYLFNDRREFEEEEEESSRESDEAEAALRLKLNTINYDIKYTLPELGKFETIVGIQGMFQTNENFGEEMLIPDADIKDFGILGTTHYHLDKTDLQAGLRFDYRSLSTESAGMVGSEGFFPELDREFTSFNAAIGAKTALTDNISGRINLASGYRAPNLAELTSNGVHEGTNRYEIGNNDLENEQNFQADLSLEFLNEHVEIAANGFFNQIKDYIFISPTGEIIGEEFVFEYLQDNAKLYGGEVSVHIHPHPLDWLHIESSFESVRGKLDDDSSLPLIPANTFQNTLRVEFEKGWIVNQPTAFISLENTLAQNNIATYETMTDGYNLLSLGFGGTFKFNTADLRMNLSVSNLLDTVYVAHLSRLKNAGVNNMGRNVNINLKLAL